METLLFIRHGETDLAGRFCGSSDPPVNERGHRQIGDLLTALGDQPIEAVYTSDLSRAVTTAAAICAAYGLTPIAIPGLREIDFGEWEGLRWEEIESRDRAYAVRWSRSYPDLAAPGGEQFSIFQARVLTEVRNLLAEPSPRLAAVVTHGGVMRVVLSALCGLDEQTAWAQTSTYCCFFRYSQGRLE